MLTARLREAVANQAISVKPEAFAPFIADVQAARQQPLLQRTDLRGTSMALAVDAIQKGNLKSMRASLVTTIFFGLIFLGCQVHEFRDFVFEKHMTISNSILGSTFFTLTGTHGIHVAIGVVWLTSMLFYSFTGRLTQKDAMDVEIMGLYWHFVDIVWIVIFTAVYLLEYIA